MVCLNAPQQVCEPADAFWKLAVPSKSQWWAGIALEPGQHFFTLERATCINITTLALHKFRTPGLCVSEEKYFDGESMLWRKSSGQILVSRVKFNLVYVIQRLLHPVFLVSVTNLHLPACSCASLKCLAIDFIVFLISLFVWIIEK